LKASEVVAARAMIRQYILIWEYVKRKNSPRASKERATFDAHLLNKVGSNKQDRLAPMGARSESV